MKILIVKRDKIGDMLLTTPLLAHLRRALPDAQVDVLANDYNAWVVKNHPAVNRLWVYRRTRHGGRLRWRAMLEQLTQQLAIRRTRYDVAIAANGDPSARAIARALAAGAKQTIAYTNASSGYALRVTMPLRPAEGDHEIERLLGLAVPLAVGMPAVLSIPQFTVPAAWSAEAHTWLATNDFVRGRYMVVGIGARYAATQPGVEQVLRWALMVKKTMNWDTAVAYTPGNPFNQAYPGSESMAHEIASVAPSHVRLIPPRIDLAVAIIGLAGGSIFPDGGLMHFAAISPGGVVALFASNGTRSSPARWGPRGSRVTVVDAKHRIADVDDVEVLAPLMQGRTGDVHPASPE